MRSLSELKLNFIWSVFSGLLLVVVAQKQQIKTSFSSCLSLRPKFTENPPEPSKTNPYRLSATLYPYYENEEFVYVKLHSIIPEQIPFSLFIVQARLAQNHDVIVDGRFIPANIAMVNLTRTFMCKITEEMKENNTWTNSNNIPKHNVSAFWIPEKRSNRLRVIFIATVVKDKRTYWRDVYSDKIQLGEITEIFQMHREREIEGSNIDANNEENNTDLSDDNVGKDTDSEPTTESHNKTINTLVPLSFQNKTPYDVLIKKIDPLDKPQSNGVRRINLVPLFRFNSASHDHRHSKQWDCWALWFLVLFGCQSVILKFLI